MPSQPCTRSFLRHTQVLRSLVDRYIRLRLHQVHPTPIRPLRSSFSIYRIIHRIIHHMVSVFYQTLRIDDFIDDLLGSRIRSSRIRRSTTTNILHRVPYRERLFGWLSSHWRIHPLESSRTTGNSPVPFVSYSIQRFVRQYLFTDSSFLIIEIA